MKKNIHPKYYKQSKIFVGGEEVYTVGSTKEQLNLDVWSQSHPFWTNQTKIVDSDRLAVKFEKKLTQMKSATELNAKKNKLAERIAKAKSVQQGKKATLKDMMKGFSS